MEKVTYKSLNSANVKMDNSVDASRVYDITANVNVNGNDANNINGNVRRKDNSSGDIATFSASGSKYLSINFQGVEPDEMCTVTESVNAFIADVKSKVGTESPVSL